MAANEFKCQTCLKSFAESASLRRHIRIHTGEKPFECEMCNKRFGRKDHLNSHRRKIHGDKPFRCDKNIVNDDLVRHNSFSHTGKRPNEDKSVADNESKRGKIDVDVATSKPYQCDVCNKRFKQAGHLLEHSRLHMVKKPFECEICCKGFTGRRHLVRHMLMTHKKTNITIRDGKIVQSKGETPNHSKIGTGSGTGKPNHRLDQPNGKVFSRNKISVREQIHPKIRNRDRKYVCGFCGKSFTQAQNLRRHRNIHTGRNTCSCDTCGKRYTRRDNLKKHQGLHTVYKPCECNICFMKFTCERDLVIHTRKHVEEKPLEFVVEAEAANLREAETQHLREAEEHTDMNAEAEMRADQSNVTPAPPQLHKNKSYFLAVVVEPHPIIEDEPDCKMTNHPGPPQSLNVDATVAPTVHQNRNGREQPVSPKTTNHQCHFCKRRFTRKYSMVVHMRSHTGERPYVCDICGKSFTRSDYLRDHKAAHVANKTVEKQVAAQCQPMSGPNQRSMSKTQQQKGQYSCSVCKKRFILKRKLTIHRSIHYRSRNRPHQCDICPKYFKQAGHLQDHVSAVHNGERHPCNTCGKTFNRRRNLMVHLRKYHQQSETGEHSNVAEILTGEDVTAVAEAVQQSTKSPVQDDGAPTGDNTVDQPALIAVMPNLAKTRSALNGEEPRSTEANYSPTSELMERQQNILHDESDAPKIRQVRDTNIKSLQTEKPAGRICDICHRTFSTPFHLQRHKQIHTGVKRYKCNICDKGFIRKDHLTSHQGVVHFGGKPYKCDVCQKRFVIKLQLTQHKCIHSGERSVLSEDVNMSVKTGESQRNNDVHTESALEQNCEVCKHCHPLTDYQYQRLLEGKPPYACNMCSKDFMCLSYLKRHQYQSHALQPNQTQSEKSHQCNVCKKQFGKRRNLTIHQRTVHSDVRPHACGVCSKRFKTTGHLHEHVSVVHTGERKFQCDLCEKSFSRKLHLTTHQLTHETNQLANGKLHRSVDCNENFMDKTSPVVHQPTHIRTDLCDSYQKKIAGKSSGKKQCNKKRNQCNFCRKMFRCTRDLVEHQRAHTGEKPYKCDLCSTKFARKRNLVYHLRKHKNELLRKIRTDDPADPATTVGKSRVLNTELPMENELAPRDNLSIEHNELPSIDPINVHDVDEDEHNEPPRVHAISAHDVDEDEHNEPPRVHAISAHDVDEDEHYEPPRVHAINAQDVDKDEHNEPPRVHAISAKDVDEDEHNQLPRVDAINSQDVDEEQEHAPELHTVKLTGSPLKVLTEKLLRATELLHGKKLNFSRSVDHRQILDEDLPLAFELQRGPPEGPPRVAESPFIYKQEIQWNAELHQDYTPDPHASNVEDISKLELQQQLVDKAHRIQEETVQHDAHRRETREEYPVFQPQNVCNDVKQSIDMPQVGYQHGICKIEVPDAELERIHEKGLSVVNESNGVLNEKLFDDAAVPDITTENIPRIIKLENVYLEELSSEPEDDNTPDHQHATETQGGLTFSVPRIVHKLDMSVINFHQGHDDSIPHGVEFNHPRTERPLVPETQHSHYDLPVLSVHEEHEQQRKTGGSYECKKCNRRFRRRWELEAHRRIHAREIPNELLEHRGISSEERPHMCGICGRSFYTISHLNGHIAIHSGVRRFRCDVCGRGFIRKDSLTTHMVVHSKERPFSCAICNRAYKRIGDLQDHLYRTHAGEKKYQCAFCKKNFSDRGNLRKHSQTHAQENNEETGNEIKPESTTQHGHKDELVTEAHNIQTVVHKRKNKLPQRKNGPKLPLQCDTCGKCFSQSSVLSRHKLNHSGVRNYPCEICAMSFVRKDTLIKHQRLHFGGKPYKCNTCDKRFVIKRQLMKHRCISTDARSITASNVRTLDVEDLKNNVSYDNNNKDLCEKDFEPMHQLGVLEYNNNRNLPDASIALASKDTAELKKPVRTARKHHCKVCKKTFSGKGSFTEHQRIHTGERPFECVVCKKRFIGKRALHFHYHTTHRVKKHACNICGRSFNRLGHLRRHENIHSGVKNFHCEICKKSFSRKDYLVTHIRTHAGERKNVCTICERSFHRSCDLQAHALREHTDVTSYACDTCNKTFHHKSGLAKHMSVHRMDTQKSDSRAEPLPSEPGGHMVQEDNKPQVPTDESEEQYFCPICDQKFVERSALLEHFDNHR